MSGRAGTALREGSAPLAPGSGRAGRAGGMVAAVLVAAVLVVAVLLRLWSPSALWLDEALSVNIATLPLDELPQALRSDGAPPLYYLLLHAWTGLVGTSDTAVRLLSSLCALAALPLALVAGTRLGGRPAGWAALLLLASNPFAVRYATETRMYSLVVLLVLLGVLAVEAALRDPRPGRLLAVGAVSGALALTHYWSLFLLAVVGAGLLGTALRGPAGLRLPARRTLLGLVGGGVLFLPWLPVFLFQLAHTGTPWASPPGLDQVVETWAGWSGPGWSGAVLGLVLLGLGTAAVLARPGEADGRQAVLLALPPSPRGLVLLGTSALTLLLGVGASAVGSSGYALRYSAVALVPALLAAALGLRALPPRLRDGLLPVAVALGLIGSVPLALDPGRTQADVTAAVLQEQLAPGDVVVYCPDQLGPAVSRLLPAGTRQLVYPTGASPARVDWVDYEQRNEAADPRAFAARVAGTAPAAVWLVRADDYLTFGDDCATLDEVLTERRGGRVEVLEPDESTGEPSRLVRFP